MIVETDRMYYERRMREYRAACPRPPLVFYHAPRLPPAPAKLTEHKEMLIERHVDAAPEGGFDQLWVKKKPRPPPQGNLRRGRS